MKIIDIHTHIYPDDVAKKAISRLAKGSMHPLSGCTAREAAEAAEAAAVDYSVCLPVATKPTQVTAINQFAAATNAAYERLIVFAGIFPGAADMAVQIETAAALGLRGIKIHPPFQGVYLDDPCVVELVALATAYHMPVLFHGGIDIALPYPVYASPQRAASLMDQLEQRGVKDYQLIGAHLGGFALWPDVEKYLQGRKLSFDTSFLAGRIDPSLMRRIIRNHGIDKILFGTDYPWQSVAENRDFVLDLHLGAEAEQAIFYDNAASLLRL